MNEKMKKRLKIIGFVILVIFALGGILDPSGAELQGQINEQTNTIEQLESEISEKDGEISELLSEVEVLEAENSALSNKIEAKNKAIKETSSTNQNKSVSTNNDKEQDDSDVGVYITNTGSKYHVSGCQYLRTSQISVSLSNARSSYSPCSRCNPPT